MILFSFSNKNYFLRLLFLFLMALIGSSLCSLIGVFVLLLGKAHLSPIAMNAILQILSQVGTFLLPILLLQYYDSQNCYLPLHRKDIKLKNCLYWFFIFICSLPLMSALTDWNIHLSLPDSLASFETISRQLENKANQLIELFLSRTSYWALLENLFIIALLPAFVEEFFFRGGLQSIFTKWFRSPHLAIGLSAFIFSFIHFQFFGFFPRMALGMLLGYAFYYGGSLWLPIGLHFINNASVVIWYFLFNRHWLLNPPSESEKSPELWILLLSGSLLISLGIGVYINLGRKKNV